MLRKEQNDLLTQTGPGTPGGRLFRSYWLPALLADELADNEGPPVRVKLLSERLLAFRDTQGRYGLIDEYCAHRGASLWFGRNEESGLRCPYHGWKYDYTGQCVEVPSEPEESGFCAKIKLKSYPLIERGGRNGEADLDAMIDLAAEGLLRDVLGERPSRYQRHLDGSDDSLPIPRSQARGGLGIEHPQHAVERTVPAAGLPRGEPAPQNGIAAGHVGEPPEQGAHVEPGAPRHDGSPPSRRARVAGGPPDLPGARRCR